MALSSRRRTENAPYWPGFVDALSQLLLVIIFLLAIFSIVQFLQAREIAGQDSALGKLRNQISELTRILALEKNAKQEAELALQTLNLELDTEKSNNMALSQRLSLGGINDLPADKTIAGLQESLKNEKEISAQALSQIEVLNQQMFALRRQLAQVSALLDAGEVRNKDSEVQIQELGKRLNAALAQRVQELSRYRSEFFGRLREILSDRPDILVVGDRFIFQSEVLFQKGSADLNMAGIEELKKFADAAKILEQKIPKDIAWVLRVDGHTDVDPIQSSYFKSNWELSSTRAINVVKYLLSRGIAPEHLVAAGFAEFQPLDSNNSEEAKSRNRRIELKLTER